MVSIEVIVLFAFFSSLPNELLWFIFMMVDLSVAVVLFKFFKRDGLYMLIVGNIILANIQVVKLVELFGFTATLGNILYGSIFFATDILSEIYGKKEARRGVILGFASLLMMTLYMQFALYIKPIEELMRFKMLSRRSSASCRELLWEVSQLTLYLSFMMSGPFISGKRLLPGSICG